MTLHRMLEEAIAAWDTCPESERQTHLGAGLTLPGDWYAKLTAVREAIAGTAEDPVRGCRVMLEALNAERDEAIPTFLPMPPQDPAMAALVEHITKAVLEWSPGADEHA